MRSGATQGIVIACGMVFIVGPALAQDAVRGGVLYDKWWSVNGQPAPTGDHPLYPAVGQQSGNTTFRCKECHGWDYAGAAGAYGSGSHFTGIGGVLDSTLTPAQMFALIKNPDGDGSGGTTVSGHDYGAIGLSDADILDLVECLQTALIDTTAYIDGSGAFLGDAVQGQSNYLNTPPNGSFNCSQCHGLDGTALNFGTPEDPEWVGTVAVHNPWELMHKVRFGQPGTVMPSWIVDGGTTQGVADLGRYAQLTFPTGSPPIPTVSEWGLVALGAILLGAGAAVVRRRRQVPARSA